MAIALILTWRPWVCADTLPPRYDLRAGDHLVYREQLERRVTTPQAESLIRLEWRSLGLVMQAGADGFVMGFQRNRIAGSLVRYQEKGRDRLNRERPAFEGRLAKQPRAFAEANRFRVSGAAVLPWSALREARSEALPYFHEIEPLPLRALQPGESWSRPGDIPATVRASGEERVGDGDCLHFEAAPAERALRVRCWLEILDKKDGWAEVEAQIGEDGTIEVKTRGVRRLRLLLRRELAAPGVRVLLNGRPVGPTPLGEDCALLLRSWRATGDPHLAHSGEMLLDPEP